MKIINKLKIMNQFPATRERVRTLAVFNIIAGAVGLFAAFELATEYIKKLKNPEYVTNCDLSILVTCGPNMESWQGSVFGFSNTILGLMMFTAPIFVGAALLAGARFNRFFWLLYLAGLTFGIGFVFWLSFQSIFIIGTLCPWCMVVWTATIPLFWINLSFALKHGVFGRKLPGLASWSWVAILASYLLIAVMAQANLNWIGQIF